VKPNPTSQSPARAWLPSSQGNPDADSPARRQIPVTATGIGVNSFLATLCVRAATLISDWLGPGSIAARFRLPGLGLQLESLTGQQVNWDWEERVCSVLNRCFSAGLPYSLQCNQYKLPEKPILHLNLEWKPMTCH